MTTRTIVTRGFASGGSAGLVVTRGYAAPVTAPISGGGGGGGGSDSSSWSGRQVTFPPGVRPPERPRVRDAIAVLPLLRIRIRAFPVQVTGGAIAKLSVARVDLRAARQAVEEDAVLLGVADMDGAATPHRRPRYEDALLLGNVDDLVT